MIEPLSRVRDILVDLDGVIYRGNTLLPGAAEFLRFLERHQIRFSLLTNNSTFVPEQYAAKLRSLGISVSADSIFTSGQAVALHLKRVAPTGAGVYVLGEEGLLRPALEAGFWLDESNPEFVLVGLDRDLSYEKLSIATLAVRRGAKLVASNPDTTFPSEVGLLPGCGAIVAALEASTSQKAVVVGKPNPKMLRLAMRRTGASNATTAILGDRLDTDVLGGKRVGIKTILVLTGVTTRDQLDGARVRPDVVIDDLNQLIQLWEAALQ